MVRRERPAVALKTRFLKREQRGRRRQYALRVSEPEGDSTSRPRQGRDRTAFLLIITGTFGLQVLTLMSGVVTARLLGVQGRGEIALVFALSVMASQLSFGGSLPIAIAKGLAERQLAARDGLRAVARRRGAWLVAPCVASGAVLLMMRRADLDEATFGLAAAVVVMTFQTIAFRILVGGLQGEVGHLGRMAIVGLVPQLGFTIALMTAWGAGWDWGVFEVVVAYFVASFIGLAVGLAALAKPTRRPEDALDDAELWSATRQTYVSSVRPLDSIGLDRILVGAWLGVPALGLYAVAIAVASISALVSNAVAVIVLPRVAMTSADGAAQRAVIRRWIGFAIVTIAGAVLMLELIAAPAIRIAFGEEFLPATEVTRWLILGIGLLGVRRVLIAVLQGKGRGSTASWVELALTPAMVLGVLLASLEDSLTGIGITMTAVGTLSCLVLGVRVWTVTPAVSRSAHRRPRAPDRLRSRFSGR